MILFEIQGEIPRDAVTSLAVEFVTAGYALCRQSSANPWGLPAPFASALILLFLNSNGRRRRSIENFIIHQLLLDSACPIPDREPFLLLHVPRSKM